MEYSGLRHPHDAEQLESLRRWLREKEDEIARLQAEIERLHSLLRESIRVPQQLNAGALSPVAWRKDYERRVRETLGDG